MKSSNYKNFKKRLNLFANLVERSTTLYTLSYMSVSKDIQTKTYNDYDDVKVNNRGCHSDTMNPFPLFVLKGLENS